MKKRSIIRIKNFEITVELNSSETANIIWNSLPITEIINTWGKEIYFKTNIDVNLDSKAKDVINFGEIVYWPDGKVIAIGFGKTPISLANEIRLASKCNVWGKTGFDLKKLNNISNGELVSVNKAK